jgi:hypothetical protein
LDDLLHPLAADLTGGGIDAIEGIDRRDPDYQRRQLGLENGRIVEINILTDPARLAGLRPSRGVLDRDRP